jgi:twinkle protein|tara:strand:- start:7581 stop:9281 length:1701 start_codon:yes stop_codon:yes gene_type:complete
MDTEFIELHKPCPVCNSSDACSINEDGSAKCFSCGEFFPDYYDTTGEVKPMTATVTKLKTKKENALEVPKNGIFARIEDRNISEKTARKYGVKIVYHGNEVGDQIFPYYADNQLVATKIKFRANGIGKNFRTTGFLNDSGLFGEHLFKGGGKFLTIVEGEYDALAAYEMLGSKWAVVSIKTGAQGAVRDVKDSLEFVESFDNVVICFDRDKPGQEAAKKVARILTPGKAKIMRIPNGYKDANDMLIAGSKNAFSQTWWESKTYTPTGVINVSDHKLKFFTREKKKSVPYPYEGLNKKLYGLRQGELVTLTGGTGLGKSSVTRELEHWLIKTTDDNVGIIALEEDPNRTIGGILSIEANARLYIDQELEKFSEEEIDRYFDVLYNGDNENRVWVHAHFGTNSIEEIFSKLRYMIVGCNCKWVVIDHLHMLVSAVTDGDERRAIDRIMTKLRSIVEETGAGLILVSHLRRVVGNKGHEDGIQVNLSHLRGSQSIAQLSDCVIGLERNQQSDDPQESNTTLLRVLKSRYTGDVGLASRLLYDRDTGRLKEIAAEEFEKEGSDLEFDAYA